MNSKSSITPNFGCWCVGDGNRSNRNIRSRNSYLYFRRLVVFLGRNGNLCRSRCDSPYRRCKACRSVNCRYGSIARLPRCIFVFGIIWIDVGGQSFGFANRQSQSCRSYCDSCRQRDELNFGNEFGAIVFQFDLISG